MELKEIRQLIDLMKKNGLSVFKMEKEDFKITLKKEADTIQQTIAYPPAYPAAPVPVASPSPVAPAADTDASSSASESENFKEITSPMVGTFYTSASPESPAYVKVGQEVTPDTIVCIVEAMKVMNEIKAEISGVIAEVCADNGKPVQFGQPLFRIR